MIRFLQKLALGVCLVALTTGTLSGLTMAAPSAKNGKVWENEKNALFDIVIENGRVVDGAGNPWFKGDIGIKDGRIARIGSLKNAPARERIDATGLYVSPGFIDIHSHSDAMPFMQNPDTGKLLQGVTTELVGNCGVSMTPWSPKNLDLLKKYFTPFSHDTPLSWDWPKAKDLVEAAEKTHPVLNFGYLVGHGAIRIAVMGNADREPTAAELEKMKALAVESVRDGAFGMSSGLVYPPGMYSKPEEIIAICKAIAPLGGIYTTHMRSETDEVAAAVQEAIEVADKAGIPVQISHHKTAGVANWGKSAETLKLISEARAGGLDVTFDVYPYTSASTALAILLPPWALEGSDQEVIARLKSPDSRARIKKELETGLPGWQNTYKASGWDKILIAWTKNNKSYEGKTMAEIAAQKGLDPADALFSVLLEEEGAPFMIVFMMHEDDITAIMQHPAAMIASDGVLSAGKPHPRYYGTFPRVLGKYVRQDKKLNLEEAIHKMTSAPAQRLSIRDRGLIKEGMWADITVFNADTVEDKATYLKPQQAPAGIEYVLVNGNVEVRKGKYTGQRAGMVLRR